RAILSLSLPLPPRPTLFPYTTLFRSRRSSKLQLKVLHLTAEAIEATDLELATGEQPACLCALDLDTPLDHGAPGIPVQSIHPSADRKSARLNSSHVKISYAVFCLKQK